MLKAVTGKEGDYVTVIFADKEGVELNAEIHIGLFGMAEPKTWQGGAFTVSGICVCLKGNPEICCLKVRVIVPAKMAQVIPSIDDDKRAYLIQRIKYLIGYLEKKDAEYYAIIKAVLTDERISRLAELPASLTGYGRYLGGALLETVAVAEMSGWTLQGYCKVSGDKPKNALLLAAALLRKAAMPEYCDADDILQPSIVGVFNNYSGCLDALVYGVVAREHIDIKEAKLALLMNTIRGSYKDSKSGCTAESVVLQSMTTAFIAMNRISRAKEEIPEGVSYVRKGGRFIVGDNVFGEVIGEQVSLLSEQGA